MLVIALQSRKRIQSLIPRLQSVFQYIICTEAPGRNPMSAGKLLSLFNVDYSIKIISNPISAIRFCLNQLIPKDAMAIVGTHCLGPAISKVFKLSFDKF